MPDDIDRDQLFNEQQLEVLIDRARSQPTHGPSRSFCLRCGEPIPEKRRQLLPGVTLCIDCQTDNEQKQHP